MKKTISRSGFTLMEVNLSIFIMAVGILSMCSLYTLGYRENRQSVEDVAAAAYADTYLAPLIQGLTATNLPWSDWKSIGDTPTRTESRSIADGLWPAGGWAEYVRQVGGSESMAYRMNGSARSRADGVFAKLLAKVPSPYKGQLPSIPSEYEYALVMTRSGAKIQLAFRAARRLETLMSQPLFVTEVHFQGDPDR